MRISRIFTDKRTISILHPDHFMKTSSSACVNIDQCFYTSWLTRKFSKWQFLIWLIGWLFLSEKIASFQLSIITIHPKGLNTVIELIHQRLHWSLQWKCYRNKNAFIELPGFEWFLNSHDNPMSVTSTLVIVFVGVSLWVDLLQSKRPPKYSHWIPLSQILLSDLRSFFFHSLNLWRY